MNILQPKSAMPMQAGNPMQMPQQAPAGPSMLDHMEAQHAASKAKLDKLDEVQAKQKAVRQQLSQLTTLGDLVDEDDLVRSASKIVAAGVEPMAVASLLADAPAGGEALAAWVSGQEQQFRQKEAQLGAVLGMVRHETGLAALRLLAAQRFGGIASPAEMAPAGGTANPLTGATPQLSPPPLGVDASNPQLAPDSSLGGNELLEAPQNGT